MKKKAQIQMGETIAILFIFFILLAAGMVFWSKYKQASVTDDIELNKIEKGIKLAQKVTFLPEVQCTKNNIIVDNCFDYHKMIAFEALNMHFIIDEETEDEIPNPLYFDSDEYYYDVFGPSRITVNQIFPYVNYTYVLYDKDLNRTSRERIQIPVTIFNSIENEHYFGVLTVDSYG
jgi:hypothetical protein